ncbi:MAG TPA: histidine phosphatase family protein [Albitalea sp.]
MDLILWRHAETTDVPEGGDGLANGLTSRGERQAHRMAQWLNHALPATTRVLVSPAKHAQQTADALDRRFRIVPALGPEGTVDALLAAARWPESREPVLVVGHQPTLGHAAGLLLAGALQPFTLRKGTVWWLRSRERQGQRQVVLIAVRSPEHV